MPDIAQKTGLSSNSIGTRFMGNGNQEDSPSIAATLG
jgi:hypothetical protein